MTDLRYKPDDEPPDSPLGVTAGLLTDRLLAFGWVISYTIILAIFQLFNYMESILKRKNSKSLARIVPLFLFVGGAVFGFAPKIAAQDIPASQYAKPSDAKTKAKAQPADDTSKSTPSDPSSEVDPEYRIGINDQLMITVWKEPEMSGSVVVRSDGMITLPLLNDIRVLGLKPTPDLQQLLTEKLKPFVSDPQVTVTVQGSRSRKVFLVGKAAKQGEFILEGEETVLQLLAIAGGITPFAKGDSIYILRKVNGKQVRIPFQYKKAIKGRSQYEDVILKPGDVIVVP
jgi:polysaccharide export outer membrane protein